MAAAAAAVKTVVVVVVVVVVAVVVAAVVAAAAGGAVEGAAGVCQEYVAVGFENQVTLAVFDGVEALSCVLVRESSCGWVGSEGRSWAAWGWRMEAGWVGAQHHWHYQAPWSLQGLRSLEWKRQTVLQGCWLGAKAALTSGSATEERRQR